MKFIFNFNNLLVLLFIISIFMIVIQWARSSYTCKGPKIMYKYIPRDFDSDENYPDGISTTFKSLFRDPTPYIVNLGNNNKRNINV